MIKIPHGNKVVSRLASAYFNRKPVELTPEQKAKRDEKTMELMKKNMQVPCLNSLFYSMVVFQGYLLPLLEDGYKLIKQEFSQKDKALFEQICKKATEIIQINDRMVEGFYTMSGGSFTVMQSEANQIARIILWLTDRCNYDQHKWNIVENYLINMPSGNIIDESLINSFRLK